MALLTLHGWRTEAQLGPALPTQVTDRAGAPRRPVRPNAGGYHTPSEPQGREKGRTLNVQTKLNPIRRGSLWGEKDSLMNSSGPQFSKGDGIIPITQMRSLRPREAKHLAPDHITGKW